MRRLHYHLVDVFTNKRFGGNQLAVFLNGRDISGEMMQQIARELNLSESTFILPPEDPANHYKVRIFTPGKELPMAGHPTIGTSFILAREHMVNVDGDQTVIRLEEGVGLVPVKVDLQDGKPVKATMQQPLPTFGPDLSDRRALIADTLGISVDDLDPNYPNEVVSCGVPVLMIPLKSMEAIQKIKVRLDLCEQLLEGLDMQELFVFTRETALPTSTVHSRMFAPMLGIYEDPATGAASGPLGSYLVKYGIVEGGDSIHIVGEQGFEMGRESIIHIDIERTNGEISGVYVGGESVYVGEGFLEI
jgi:trans-2,3-dihydro-3-hydroxyanthranilate isomerase